MQEVSDPCFDGVCKGCFRHRNVDLSIKTSMAGSTLSVNGQVWMTNICLGVAGVQTARSRSTTLEHAIQGWLTNNHEQYESQIPERKLTCHREDLNGMQ